MGKIQFGSEVYTWFMQRPGEGCANKLDDKFTGGCRAATACVPSKRFSDDMLGSSRLAAIHEFGGNMRGSFDPMTTGWTADVGLIAALNKWQHLVNHIHYKDYSGNGAEPWSQMGTGKLDFHKIIQRLTRWITIEFRIL